MKKAIVVSFLSFSLLIRFSFPVNKVILFKFYNASEYEGSWDISRKLTDMVNAKLNNTGKFIIFPKSYTTLSSIKESESTLSDVDILVEYASRYNANLVITGVIKRFYITTTGITSPGLGGWKMYNARCDIDYQIVNVYDKKSNHKQAKGHTTSHDVGFTILGGPGGSADSDGMSVMDEIEKLKFGSELFWSSILGKSVDKCITSITSNLVLTYPADARSISAKVIDIEPGYVYINIGLKNNIIEGQEFLIYNRGDSVVDPDTGEMLGFKEIEVAIIKIKRVLAAKFSKATIVKVFSGQKIKLKDTIKFLSNSK